MIMLRPNAVARHGLVPRTSNAGRLFTASGGVKPTLISSKQESIPPSLLPSSALSVPALVLYNSLSQQKDPVQMSNKTKGIACYCCGPTVYDDAHLGHARTYVWFDLFRRILEHQYTAVSLSSSPGSNCCTPPPPLFVMNITDVDDKILKAASAKQQSSSSDDTKNLSPLDYARHYERKFWTDLDALNCLRPHVVVRVSEHVDDSIIPYIQTLIDKGMAYQQLQELDDKNNNNNNDSNLATNDEQGGVLFDVVAFEQADHKYGKLVPNLRSSSTDLPHRDDTQQYEENTLPAAAAVLKKKDPRDFALWKRKKGDESLFWDSPWGAGRPGWHIECSAMIESVRKLFPSHEFLIHAGGIDLKFPHHTNEIAQAEAYHHHCCSSSNVGNNGNDPRGEWIPHWMHMGHLHIGGLKMSKSLKNFITIESQRKENAEWADNFRLWCLALSGSYRDATTYSEDRMDESRNVRAKLVRFLVGTQTWISRRKEIDFTSGQTLQWQAADLHLFAEVNVTRARLQNALLDDLNGAACVDALISLIERGNDRIRSDDDARHEPMEAALQLIRSTLQLLGFHKQTYEAGLHDNADDAAMQSRKVVLDEFTKFRSTVRRAAISDHQDRVASSNMKHILEACDHLRDKTFPSMGLELIDRSLRAGASTGDDENDAWQFCVPHINYETPAQSKTTRFATNVTADPVLVVDIEPTLLFHSGVYKGQFCEYDEAGIPLKLADGSLVSKSQTKKLRKLLEKYQHKYEATRSKSRE
jgi:cysteinyl-tRNA synthetase